METRSTYSKIRSAYVKLIYANHNNSFSVKKALMKVLSEIKEGDIGLNVGAGTTKLHPQIKNLDIFPGKNIDYIGKAEAIPVDDNVFKIVISQETLEHVQDPFKAAAEVFRVLRPNGLFYCQLPFIIGYHPGPTDYWRFTKEGIRELLEKQGFVCEEIGISVGGATGFYRIFIEFLSVLLSTPFPFLYHFFKAIFSLILFPIKWLDFIMSFSQQKDRISGGYYIIARK
jgi:SAM-dependent methyltransferase